MNDTAYFEAFAFNPRTVEYDIWRGTATLAAIRKAGLRGNLAFPNYGDKALGGADGWACKAPPQKAA